jgi:hypothetical protein
MVRYINKKINGQFLTATLTASKVQTKSLSMQEKIEMWNNIFQIGSVFIDQNVSGKQFLLLIICINLEHHNDLILNILNRLMRQRSWDLLQLNLKGLVDNQ